MNPEKIVELNQDKLESVLKNRVHELFLTLVKEGFFDDYEKIPDNSRQLVAAIKGRLQSEEGRRRFNLLTSILERHRFQYGDILDIMCKEKDFVA